MYDQETGQIGFYHNGRPLSFVSPLTARRLRGQLTLAVSGTDAAAAAPARTPVLTARLTPSPRGAVGTRPTVAPPAEVEVTFNSDEFSYPLEERGYAGIMVARSLI